MEGFNILWKGFNICEKVGIFVEGCECDNLIRMPVVEGRLSGGTVVLNKAAVLNVVLKNELRLVKKH